VAQGDVFAWRKTASDAYQSAPNLHSLPLRASDLDIQEYPLEHYGEQFAEATSVGIDMQSGGGLD